MSDLWMIWAEQIFSATGSPTRRAISTASSAELARPPGTTGTPLDSSSSRAAASDHGPEAAPTAPTAPVLPPADRVPERVDPLVQPAQHGQPVLSEQLPAVGTDVHAGGADRDDRDRGRGHPLGQ